LESKITKDNTKYLDATIGPLATTTPSKQARKALCHANSIFNLPSTKQAIKWKHTICGYLIKSTWLKAIKAGNYVGWQMLTECNVQKFYPKIVKTAKGHLKLHGPPK
jgi:hypothetical protein